MPKTSNIDFICIGAQKAGTTWLWRMFRQLSEFTLPPVKELHYFDRSKRYPSPNKLAEPYLINRLKDIQWVKYLLKTSTYHIRYTSWSKFPWLFNWYFSTYRDEWYLSLFKSLDGIAGEISPSYSILEKEDVKKMHDLLPDVKLIFLLRNPIERAWSLHRFGISKGFVSAGSVDYQRFAKNIGSTAIDPRADYISTLENFTAFFHPEQLLIGFYDAIKENPVQLLSDIVGFLGGDISKIKDECKLHERVNVSMPIDMPIEIREALKEKYYAMMKELSVTLGGYCAKWFNDLYQEGSDQYNLVPTVQLKEKYSVIREKVSVQILSDKPAPNPERHADNH
jgi:hypothetical protein